MRRRLTLEDIYFPPMRLRAVAFYIQRTTGLISVHIPSTRKSLVTYPIAFAVLLFWCSPVRCMCQPFLSALFVFVIFQAIPSFRRIASLPPLAVSCVHIEGPHPGCKFFYNVPVLCPGSCFPLQQLFAAPFPRCGSPVVVSCTLRVEELHGSLRCRVGHA